MRTSKNSPVWKLSWIAQLGCSLALLAMFSAGLLQAQESTRINVGFASAKPSDEIDIPLTFSGAEGSSANSLSAHVSFPSNILTFTTAERALAAELADAEVKATASPDKDNKELSVLDVNITGKSCIKPGIVAYMKFKVNKDAQKGELKLDLLDSSAKGCEDKPLELAKGDSGSVTLFNMDEEIPVVGCFFFTH
jgi:hypothetical protein